MFSTQAARAPEVAPDSSFDEASRLEADSAPPTVGPRAWALLAATMAAGCAWVPTLAGPQIAAWRPWGLALATALGGLALWLIGRRTPPPPVERLLDDARHADLQQREAAWHARSAVSVEWHWSCDADLRINWVSPDLGSVLKLGIGPQELLGRCFWDVPLLGAPENGWPAVQALVQARRDWREVILPVRRQGRVPTWVSLSAKVRRDATGAFEGYDGVGRDVSEQRLAHLKLQDSEQRHELMSELSADWYWQTDEHHRLVHFGPILRALLGERADRALGRTHWEAFRYGASEAEWQQLQDDLGAGRPFRDLVFAIRRKGMHWVSLGGRPRHDAKGRVIGYHGVGRDITLDKRAERLLVQRNRDLTHLVDERTAALAQTNRDLEGFARHIAHELRTPIGHIAGLAELLRKRLDGRLTDQEREWLRLQEVAATEMSHTVTALLELARSTASELQIERVDLSLLARSVIAELPSMERVAEVLWVVQDGAVARCSSSMVRVVLINLLGNAAKFTRDMPAPRVEFGMREDGRSFYVQDNGAGFEEHQAQQLFQPFARLHTQKQFPGTGVGLSIVRRIVERHGGSIAAQGALGHGATFEFTLSPPPAAAPADVANEAANEAVVEEFGEVSGVIAGPASA
jgi:PAS domain S-box-containing protein